jgi:hypothetical protein
MKPVMKLWVEKGALIALLQFQMALKVQIKGVTICNKLLFEILHEETNQSSQM